MIRKKINHPRFAANRYPDEPSNRKKKKILNNAIGGNVYKDRPAITKARINR